MVWTSDDIAVTLHYICLMDLKRESVYFAVANGEIGALGKWVGLGGEESEWVRWHILAAAVFVYTKHVCHGGVWNEANY